MINCGNSCESELDNQSEVPAVTLFEATRQLHHTNLSLEQLGKTIRILRKRQEQYGRTNKYYQEELVRLIDSRFRQQPTRVSQRQVSAQTTAPSLHMGRPSNTRETSQRLRRALQEVRQFEARSVRDSSEQNERRLRERRQKEIQAKRKKRDGILGLQKALRESYSDFRCRRQLQTSEQKRRDIAQLVMRKQNNERLLSQLLEEKENLLDCMQQGSKLQMNMRMTLKKVALTKAFKN